MDATLCIVMVARGRVRMYSALFTLVALDLIFTGLLFGISHKGSRALYSRVYVLFDVLSFCAQIAVLVELARRVLRPMGIWKPEAVRLMCLAGAAGAIIAFFATFLLEPAGLIGGQAIEVRADMFTGLLTCELVIAMMLSAGETGLLWRNHVMAIGTGLMFWALATVLLEGLVAYFGPQYRYYEELYYLRALVYIGTVTYWAVSLWRKEPERRPISPALRKYVVALHERVQYDLGKVGN